MAGNPIWLTLATAMLGGGIVSGTISFLLETRRSEKNLLRLKLEEVHTEFDRASRNLTAVHGLLKQYANGESDLQGFMRDATAYVEKLSEPRGERVSSLCAIYFPELVICHKSFLKAKDRFSALMNDRKGLMSRSEEFVFAVSDSYGFLKEMDEAMRSGIYRSANRINLSIGSRLINAIGLMGR
ncbi:Uncharacterised protein [Pseudomonas putida]|uniref:hypothetical protein n=1 Tax=Pseudomonas sp. HTZ2 TaxID=3075220 RepID=UPI001F8EB76C|nr:hypothetical protein [Pseudomonas sp. HTZ2]CAB5577247.1 Uncharacterised protein [Pseudomonas putida]CAB5578195.1 Uncharacterised protein [Pseudomonas putida]CAB5620774.1 Uncharacterised protein [Pseudomonas putida]CAB5622272.1 Uncharacterised protein [Pseudomonas putida]CAB5702572.1 Uncharacterised protein [Pseudomonas putida]